MAGAEGFEPTNAGSKDRCLTTWRRPSMKDRVQCQKRATVSRRHSIEPLLTRGLLTRGKAQLGTARAPPSYKERRANQFRVRSPEWRIVAHLRYQKSQTLLSRCPPAVMLARP